jgi:hypothetical protein
MFGDKIPKTYEENTKEQYEALGRFVEAFELMVNEVRESCVECLCYGMGNSERERLAEIAFHHQSMTAKPLFDIMRAIIAEIVNSRASIHYSDRDKFKKILGVVENEFSHLSNKRNDILHGTWFIGFRWPDDPNASKFFLRKFKTSADGLVGAKELPKNAHELLDLTMRCGDVRAWVGWVETCISDGVKISDFFEKRDGTWILKQGLGGAYSLPRK